MLTPDQRIRRQNGIGGSDVGAIFDVSPWATRFSLYQSKVNPLSDDHQKESRHMAYGRMVENTILDLYEYETNSVVERNLPTYHHSAHPILFGNFDGLVGTNIVVEAKNCSSLGVGPYNGRAWGAAGTDEIPLHYLLQIAHYCMIANCKEAHLAAYFGGANLIIYKYQRDEEIEKNIIKMCLWFWNHHILPRIPPLETASSKEICTYWKPPKEDKEVMATPEIMEAVSELRKIREEKRLLDAREEESRKKILLFMTDHNILMDSDKQPLVTAKTYQRRSLDTEKVKEHLKDNLDQYMTSHSGRTFIVKGDKNAD